jgi:ATP-dependent DNA ligase
LGKGFCSALQKIMPSKLSRLLYVEHVVGRGEDLFKLVCAGDLEGVVAKWKRGGIRGGRPHQLGEDQETSLQSDHRAGETLREAERIDA